MVEVTLISVANKFSQVGHFVARKRANLEMLGVSKSEFLKGFLKNNLSELETVLNNADLVRFISSDSFMTNKDFQSINFTLGEVGYIMIVGFVADDEINPTSVPSGTVEYNIIDSSFIQEDLPTITKISREVGGSIAEVLRQIISQSGLFNPNTLAGVKNPFSLYLNNIRDEESTTGTISSSLAGMVYQNLEFMGIKVMPIIGD